MIVFTCDGVEYDVEDLPIERWIQVQKQTGLKWHECLGQPLLGDMTVAKAVLEACAAETGVTLPKLTVKAVVKLFRFDVADSVPAVEDGQPDPKAADTAQATT